MVRIKLVAVLLILLLLLFTIVVVASTEAAYGRQCYARAWPRDLGGGTLWDKNYFLYVEGSQVPQNGFFLYRNSFNLRWYTIRFSSWGPEGNYTRFGVSTRWAYRNPGWLGFYWRYVWNC